MKITVVINPDNMIWGMSSDDIASIDVEATAQNYASAVRRALGQYWPSAEIEVDVEWGNSCVMVEGTPNALRTEDIVDGVVERVWGRQEFEWAEK